MKNYIIIFALIFSFQYTKAQDFKTTEKYIAVSKLITKQQDYTTNQIDIVALNDTSKKIATIQVPDLDFFEELRITVLPNPNLKDVNEVIKVELEYNACCINTETYYFLAKNNEDYVALPSIQNTYCDTSVTSVKYIFPSEAFGQTNTILTAAIKQTTRPNIKGIDILKQMVWNDDDFYPNNTITATYTQTKY